ncbi:hypothetical protein AHF37_08980 [Paragonimus kellicotti]|nr:hypothetical protein AHF37_08980 [Paragonimus kellicotti]
MVDIEQPLPSWSTDKQDRWTKKEQENQTEEVMRGVNRAEKHSLHTVEGRVMILGQINVASLKSTSVSISPEVLRINYDPEHEECRLSYTSPDFGSKITNNMDGSVEVETGSISGTYAPKLGLPLAAGAAVGGVQRWPLFGQVVAFNRRGITTRLSVNVTHIGGSLSVLPRDSISVPHDAVPGLEYLDVNMTKMQGPLQAQIVNLRDPTRPVTSFRLLDLRRGLIALQLLNYAESLVKVGYVSYRSD